MPLAPLTSSSSLVYRTASSLEEDQICARRSLNDNRGTSCDHVRPCDLWPTSDGVPGKLSLEHYSELNHKIRDTTESAVQHEENVDLFLGENSKSTLTEKRKSIIEEYYYLGREVTNFEVGAADNFLISEESRVAILTLGVEDPFVQRPIKSVIVEEMPHKSHKHHLDGKSRCKKDKSAGHHHGAPISKTRENVSHQISVKQKEVSPPAGENFITDTSAEFEDLKTKLVIDTSMTAEKTPGKHHGKKKKKHGQNTTAQKTVEEPPADEDYGAKPKTAKGKIDMFEAKLGAKAVKVQRNSSQPDAADKTLQVKEINASQEEPHLCQAENKDHQPKKFQVSSPSPMKEDIIKKRRLSEDKFGKILNILESKLPKPDVDNKGKKDEPKADVVSTSKKAYSEAVKKNLTAKEEPKVVQPIQAVSVSGDPQSLCLWCQFAAVFCDYTVTWSRDNTLLNEVKRSAGDESRVSFNIVNASHKDLGKYQCQLSSLHGSVTLDYLLTYEVLSEIIIPPSPQITASVPVEVVSEEEDVLCSRLLFKEDFLSDQYFGDNQPVSIITEKVHFGEGMHRRAFRTKMNTGQTPFLVSGHCCVLKVHNAISYGTKNNEELIQKNFTLAVEECQVQNTAREYIRAYTAAAQSTETFGEVPEIIPIYLVHRPSNDIPYATLEEELIGNFVKYSVKDGKEINQLRRDSVAGQKCCAFQHWVYHHTEGNLLVTDMQGVGMKLTDVGIATCRKGYKGFKGNCSTSFIDQFKALHQCNMFCEILGLDSLQPKPRKPLSAPKSKPQPPAAPKKKTFGSTLKSKS
ncbi:alpha-protein kinase 2 [Cynoglossus semilaevis]|uniref:alpha-protein kinase 2 n=1 Tax=Cynoglossus semilaevis TaxID=244447 RepID=UPI0004976090|nr:alpha-protein kinase 2 [Cynoglossus semilaevis]